MKLKAVMTRLLTVVILLASHCLFAEDKDKAIKDTIAHINHLNWVVSKIKTYNNVMVHYHATGFQNHAN